MPRVGTPLQRPLPKATPADKPAAPAPARTQPLDSFEPLRRIADASLGHNVQTLNGGRYLSAGSNQFKSLWTRDFCWSVRGLLASGRADVVKTQLTALLAAQRDDGLLPRTLDSMNPKLRVAAATVHKFLPFVPSELPISSNLHPEYIDQYGSEAIDGNALIVFAALEYVKATGDEAFWKANEPKLVKAFRYYDAKMKDGLVQQPEYSDWQDSAKRQGASFYTNLLYQTLLERLSDKPAFGISSAQVASHRAAMEQAFFDSKSGLYRSMQSAPQLGLDANLWAIDLGYVKGDDAKKLWIALKASELYTRYQSFGFNVFPDYDPRDVSPIERFVGVGHYHDELEWSQLIALSAKVAHEVGDDAVANAELEKLQSLAQRDGAIAEIYEPKQGDKAFSSWGYSAEKPFSWGAAETLETIASLKK